MILEAFENFLLFGTAFALAGFALAWMARVAARRRRDVLRPSMLTRVYTLALVLPPLAAAWLVAAALLPCWWLGELGLYAAHPVPFHGFHLIGDLTGRLEPVLAYTVVLLVAGTVLVVAWSTARGYRQLVWAVARLQLTGARPPAAHLATVGDAATRHGLDVGLVSPSSGASAAPSWCSPRGSSPP